VTHSISQNSLVVTSGEQEETQLSSETKQNMLLEMLKCTLAAYRVNENVKAEEVYQVLDPTLLDKLQGNIEVKFTETLEHRKTQAIKKPLESDERLSQCFEFDLGQYPLTPWLNKQENDPQI
jgi:hypothetical protein